MSKDMVKRPDHYCFSKFEPKDVIREWGLNFNLGSAVKYIARAGRKDDIVQDLKKAREFLSFEIEALEADRGLTEEGQKELEEITKKNAEISRALRFYRGFRGLVSKLGNDYCMKRLGVDDMLDGYTVAVMRVGQIVTLKKNTSRRLRVLAISDWDIVTVMDLADKTEKEFEIGQLQRVRRIKQYEG